MATLFFCRLVQKGDYLPLLGSEKDVCKAGIDELKGLLHKRQMALGAVM